MAVEEESLPRATFKPRVFPTHDKSATLISPPRPLHLWNINQIN
jgi:hypothetical protein